MSFSYLYQKTTYLNIHILIIYIKSVNRFNKKDKKKLIDKKRPKTFDVGKQTIYIWKKKYLFKTYKFGKNFK